MAFLFLFALTIFVLFFFFFFTFLKIGQERHIKRKRVGTRIRDKYE